MSRQGRVTKVGQVYTIVRNVLGEEASTEIGRVRLLSATPGSEEQEVINPPSISLEYHLMHPALPKFWLFKKPLTQFMTKE